MAELQRGDIVELFRRPAVVWHVEDGILALLQILPRTKINEASDVLVGTSHAVRCGLIFAWPLQRQRALGRLSDELMAAVEIALQIHNCQK